MAVMPQDRFRQQEAEDEIGSDAASVPRGPSAARMIAQQLAELREFASHYLAAKQDSAKLSVKQSVIYAGLGIVGLIFLSNLILAATGALVVGIALGLARLFGEEYAWLGPLATGAALLVIIAVAALIVLRRITGKSRSRTVEKYEQRIKQQSAQFGHNLHDEARRAPSE